MTRRLEAKKPGEAAAAERLVARSTREQGLPVTVEAPAVLRAVVGVLTRNGSNSSP